MIDEWELWACANTLRHQHGDGVRDVIAARIEELTATGEFVGAATFRRIGERLTWLEDETSPGPRH